MISAYDHARTLIYATCCLAGSSVFLEETESTEDQYSLRSVIQQHDTPRLFQWLVHAFSFQGIADEIASGYIERHGLPSWTKIETGLEDVACQKLNSYWSFSDCDYRKSVGTCNRPEHFSRCPLPRHQLRNGRLNQIAYGLFLFIRDIAGDDLVSWIDRQLTEASQPDGSDRIGRMIESLVGPLRHIHGVSDKVLMMSLSCLLLASDRPLWREAGANMIAVDTLVHNFLHRARRQIGSICRFAFPRFVQNAIWRIAVAFVQAGLSRIDDRRGCENGYCRLYWRCDRKLLKGRTI